MERPADPEVSMSMSTSKRVQKYRATLREAGLRPLQIWVPDTRREGFAEECRRQSLLVAADVREREGLEWLDAVADRGDWE
jgi:DNA-binding LacI/PurR family transcriptional regulator